jgi:hypothetical protein
MIAAKTLDAASQALKAPVLQHQIMLRFKSGTNQSQSPHEN